MTKQAKKSEGTQFDLEREERAGGPTDPMGHVSSGLQGGPLRGKGGRPVADTDESFAPSTHERDLAEKNVTQAELDAEESEED